MAFFVSTDYVWSVWPILKVIYQCFEIIKLPGKCEPLLSNKIIIINNSKNIDRL